MKYLDIDEYYAEMASIQRILDQDGPEGFGAPQPFDMALVSSIRATYAIAQLQLKVLLDVRQLMLLQASKEGMITNSERDDAA